MLKPETSAFAVIEPENLIWSAMIGMSGDCWPKPLPPLTLRAGAAVQGVCGAGVRCPVLED
jgi:hypothetical protein